jgi:hypothetical protein
VGLNVDPIADQIVIDFDFIGSESALMMTTLPGAGLTETEP